MEMNYERKQKQYDTRSRNDSKCKQKSVIC